MPSSGALARRRPVLGFPPPRPAAAGRCSPSAPLRCAAGCAPPRALRSPSPRCGLPLVALRSDRAPCWATAAPAGPPCLAAGAGLLGCGAAPPRAGALGPLARASGGRVPRPRAGGRARLRLLLGVPPIGSRPIKAEASGRGAPGLDSRGRRRGGVSKGLWPKIASWGLTPCIMSWYDSATDSSSIRHNEIATIHAPCGRGRAAPWSAATTPPGGFFAPEVHNIIGPWLPWPARRECLRLG